MGRQDCWPASSLFLGLRAPIASRFSGNRFAELTNRKPPPLSHAPANPATRMNLGNSIDGGASSNSEAVKLHSLLLRSAQGRWFNQPKPRKGFTAAPFVEYLRRSLRYAIVGFVVEVFEPGFTAQKSETLRSQLWLTARTLRPWFNRRNRSRIANSRAQRQDSRVSGAFAVSQLLVLWAFEPQTRDGAFSRDS